MSVDDARGFGWRATAGLISIGFVLAAAFIILGVVASDWRDGNDGGTHALSHSAVGFSGVVALANGSGLPARVTRRPGDVAAGLLVLTPSLDTDPAELIARLRAQNNAPVLIVLPKWRTMPLARRPAWVQQFGMLPGSAVVAPLAQLVPGRARTGPPPAPDFTVTTQRTTATAQLTSVSEIALTLPAPTSEATIASSALQPVLVDAKGRMVLGWLPVRNAYVLADPDLLDNVAMRQPNTASAALALLLQLGGSHGGIAFDVTLNGLARPFDLARLALIPPFLGATACLVVALGLAGVTAAARFGVPLPAARTIAFGKRVLIDNAAELIRAARREPVALIRYMHATVEAAGAATGAPEGSDPAALAAWFTARGGTGARLGDLTAAATAATDRPAVLAAARALYFWHKEVVHDRR